MLKPKKSLKTTINYLNYDDYGMAEFLKSFQTTKLSSVTKWPKTPKCHLTFGVPAIKNSQ